MGHKYNDAQMLMASKIAYLDIDGVNVSIGDVVDNNLESYGHYIDGKWVLDQAYENNDEIRRKFETSLSIVELAQKTEGLDNSWREWKIIDTCDRNDETGFYGYLIDTGDNNAIIGCRGSERYDAQAVKDWVEADFGLLDSTLTKQQADAQKYMEYLYYKYGDKYDSFSLTGHSLGGNLAQHMTIHAPAEMRDKIDHCVSLDGPGFSNEYIEANKELIEKVNGKIDHYQWSLVSSMLTVLPGVVPTVIEAYDAGMFARHLLCYVEIDSNGNVKPGERDRTAVVIGPISRYVDQIGENPLEDLLPIGPLPMVRRFIFMIKLVSFAVAAFHIVKKEVIEQIRSVYYKYFAPNVAGEYMINMTVVSSYQEELVSASKQLDEVNDEIDEIRRTWKNWSASGAYYRSQLVAIKTGLEFDIQRLRAMAKATERIVMDYSEADRGVENLF